MVRSRRNGGRVDHRGSQSHSLRGDSRRSARHVPVDPRCARAHILQVTAADCASNTAEIVLTFTVIEAVLALSGSAAVRPGSARARPDPDRRGEIRNDGTDLEE